ncbi:hypothetical protein GW17_00023649 [Ensete ventricosum]|nr:hypothetical protein GW17_00023649 [Ensete ventricosum]
MLTRGRPPLSCTLTSVPHRSWSNLQMAGSSTGPNWMPWRSRRESSTWTWTKSPLARDVLLPASGPVRFIFRPIRGGSRHQVGPLRLHGSRPRRQQRDTGTSMGRTRRMAFVGLPSLPATTPILRLLCAFNIDISGAQRVGQYPVKHPSDVATSKRTAYPKVNYKANNIRLHVMKLCVVIEEST